MLGDRDTGLTLQVVRRPRFYDLSTADGVSYEQIARLHGSDVLATTVVQTCIRYVEDQRCRFCTIEESLRSGATVAAKTPAQLAEVAEAAVRLDGIKQMDVSTDIEDNLPVRWWLYRGRNVAGLRPVNTGPSPYSSRAFPGQRHPLRRCGFDVGCFEAVCSAR